MKDNVIPFPSYLVGLQRNDKIAVVVQAENGRAVTLQQPQEDDREVGVFAHNDLIVELSIGDWVRFDETQYGALIIERLAKPGDKPLPRLEYHNGCFYIDKDDPTWRLYK